MSNSEGSGFNPFVFFNVTAHTEIYTSKPFGVPLPAEFLQRQSGDENPGVETGEQPSSNADSSGQSPSTTDDQPQPDTSNDQPSTTTDDQNIGGEDSMDSLEQAVQHGEEYLDQVEAAMSDETCELCYQILDELRGRPVEQQVQGVGELYELKQLASDGADPLEIAEKMEDFEVVADPSQM